MVKQQNAGWSVTGEFHSPYIANVFQKTRYKHVSLVPGDVKEPTRVDV